jgi:hypothetical protein
MFWGEILEEMEAREQGRVGRGERGKLGWTAEAVFFYKFLATSANSNRALKVTKRLDKCVQKYAKLNWEILQNAVLLKMPMKCQAY